MFAVIDSSRCSLNFNERLSGVRRRDGCKSNRRWRYRDVFILYVIIYYAIYIRILIAFK